MSPFSWRGGRYERLTAKSFVPKILVVLVLPEQEGDWVVHSPEQLMLRRCAYYMVTTGLPGITTKTTVVHVPLGNVFSPDALTAMLGRLSRGEAP